VGQRLLSDAAHDAGKDNDSDDELEVPKADTSICIGSAIFELGFPAMLCRPEMDLECRGARVRWCDGLSHKT